MDVRKLKIWKAAAAAAVFSLVAAFGGSGALAQEEAESIAASEAADYLGVWILEMDFQGTPVEMTLEIMDKEGKAAGLVTTSFSPDPQEITLIEKTDDGLNLSYDVDFGGNSMTLVMALSLEGGKLTGTLSDDGGLFSADLSGERKADAAPAIEASDLDVSEVKDYIGDWTLGMDFNGTVMSMDLSLIDAGGKVAATLESDQAPKQTITDITKTDDGINLSYSMSFGGNDMTINISLKLEGGKLSGTMGDEGGFFSADLTGERASGGPAVTDGAQASQSTDGGSRRRRRGGFGRRGAGRVSLTLGDKSISITASRSKTDSGDYTRFEELAEGEVISFRESQATKVRTEANLDFGGTIIKTGNVADNYPGVYSLWLKKSGDGWRAVFNEQADIWGTQHDAEFDVAEIALDYSTNDEPAEDFTIELKEEGDGGLLRLAWGPHQWTAQFKVAE